jgi:hypothetical protein
VLPTGQLLANEIPTKRNMSTIFTRMSFWTKFQLTVQTLGTFTQLSLIFGESQHIYNVLVAVIQFVGLLIPIWMEDKNNDGIVDVFEKEVTIKVTSDTPIQTEVKTENKEQ